MLVSSLGFVAPPVSDVSSYGFVVSSRASSCGFSVSSHSVSGCGFSVSSRGFGVLGRGVVPTRALS